MSKKEIVILDVRTPAEFNSGHAQTAFNIDIYASTFLVEIQKLDKTKAYELYCRSGNRSGQAEAIMKQLGFADVKNIGGLDEAAKLYSFDNSQS